MRHIGPDQPEFEDAVETTEERLLKENQELKRQLAEYQRPAHGLPHAMGLWHPSGLTIAAIVLAIIAAIVVAFFAGFIPIVRRNAVIARQAQEAEQALPRVEVIQVGRSSANSELVLPGNIQAVTEAPILARVDGYIKRRVVDIGDRVRAGQALAEIEAPELDEQVRQAQANVQQTQSALTQALANRVQGKANTDLARITAQRWNSLVSKGAVSKQENDQYQAQYQAQAANLEALEQAVGVARSNVAAAQANLSRLQEIQSFKLVKAPFDGVITLRNVDVGALVNSGSTMLYRIAQTGVLRTYVNVPQTNADSIRVGQTAQLTVSNRPGRRFTGTVTRMADSLDPNSRTMLVEVQVPNFEDALLPGMYAQVDLTSPRTNPPLLLPSDALIVRAEGTEVALVRPDHVVHFQKIQVGRDYGDRLEVLNGLEQGDQVVANPNDVVREGIQVEPVPAHQP